MLTAAQVDAQYGDELRELYPDAPTARRLHNKLLERQPPLDINDGVLKVWINNYSKTAGSSGAARSGNVSQVSEVSTGSAASTGPAPKRVSSAAAAGSAAAAPVAKRAKAAAPAPSALGGLAAGQKYLTAQELEEQYGDELREQPSDKGYRELLAGLLQRVLLYIQLTRQ